MRTGVPVIDEYEIDATSGAAADVPGAAAGRYARLHAPRPPSSSLQSGTFIPLPERFAVWSQGILRSAGFPIGGLLELGDAEYAAAVDRSLQAGESPQAAVVARADERQAELLRRIARRGDFQEAMTWQNPDLVEPMIVKLARLGPDAPHNHRLRKRQRLVANYWARYCAKNETIGFFGPVNWFSLRTGGETLRMRPGKATAGYGELFLEPWAIDVLAATLAADPEVRPWVAPRRHPTVHVSGAHARTMAEPLELSPAQARLMALVDGERLARAIAAEYGATPEEVYAELEQLATMGLLLWDLEPPLIHNAERELRARLDAIGDVAVHKRATEKLDRLERARDELAGYRDVDDLISLHHSLEREFTALTGVDPMRRPGQTYGGRRLTYLECARDVELSFGPQVLESCAEPLSLLLLSARWFMGEASRRVRAVFSEAFDTLGVDSAGLSDLVFASADKLFTPGDRPVDHLAHEFVARWRAILDLDTAARQMNFTSDELREKVEEAFPSRAPDWGFAWTHSVDLLIAARGPEAFARGEFQPVVGELHVGYCPFETPVFAWSHPDPDELRAMLAAVIPDDRVMLSPVKDFPRVAARLYPWVNNDRDWWLCVSPFPTRGTERLLPLCGLEVRRDGDRLVAGMSGGDTWFDIADVHGTWLMYEFMDVFKQVMRGYDHTPRVVVDTTVVFRETWSFRVADLDWISVRSDPEHFRAARRWRRDRELPEIVFASVSSESKPVYVDFRSEVQVASLARVLRAATESGDASVTFTEMLPEPEQSWLADEAGERYTAELRLLFVDRETDG
ncbi:lantibiotic dehydratase [Microtetraspora malaysiensis]|uniref:lantibiotic dehydratase n=1 Tax=Microtetraspora malaysiensis TaxID=161358 RepID=UPI003D8FF51A